MDLEYGRGALLLCPATHWIPPPHCITNLSLPPAHLLSLGRLSTMFESAERRANVTSPTRRLNVEIAILTRR